MRVPTKLAFTFALALAAACSPDRTMLVVRVQSNLQVPNALDSVRVVVTHGGKEIQSLPFSLTSGSYKFPLEVGLLSPSGGGSDVAIRVTGLQGHTPVVSEDAVTSFIKGKSLLLDMFLAAECVNFDCHDPDKTCSVGQECIDTKRPPMFLPIFVADNDSEDASAPHDAADGPAKSDASDVPATGGSGGAAGAGTDDAAAGAGGTTTDAKLDMPVEAAPGEVAPEVPACVPKTEDCFNGLDDDCDGKPDCADPDCAPTAICVPRPAGTVGTTVDGAGACPTGFAAAGMTTLNSGLSAATSCSGCQCGAGQTGCSADVYTQTDQASCALNTGGKFVYTMSTADATVCPIPDTNTSNVYGARLTPWNVTTTGCAPSGTPVRPAAAWGKSLRFCAAEKVNTAAGNGCAAGSVCMPKGAPGRSCLLLDAGGACPAGTAANQLFTGYTDTRTCAACNCGATGASCNNLVVQMGSDYTCDVDMADLHGGQATCVTQPGGVYVPGYKLTGTPTAPTCTPTSAVSGFLMSTGPRTVCCLP